MTVKYVAANEEFHVGMEGEFILYDAYYQPFEKVHGKILTLMEGDAALYAMLKTESGVRPARLARMPAETEGTITGRTGRNPLLPGVAGK